MGIFYRLPCYSCKKIDGGRDFHDRFILIEKGGVQFGASLIAIGGDQTENTSLKDLDFCEQERKTLLRDKEDYILVAPVVEVASDGSTKRI